MADATASRLDELAARHPLPSWRAPALLVALFIAGATGWASVARIEEVTVATGQVVPQGQVKQVQHLEGGILRAMLVKEGETVRSGQPLAQLDLPTTAMNKDEMQLRLDASLLMRARLAAEAQGVPLALPSAEALRRPEIAQAETEAFNARRRQLDSTLVVLREQARQRESDIRQLQSRRAALGADLRISRERLDISKDLVRDQLTSRLEHLQLQREVEQLNGELATIEPAIARAMSALTEYAQRERDETLKFRRDAQEQMGKAEQEVARNRELMTQASDQARRTELQSPIDGQVKNLRFNTVGGVLKPGETVMEIVPANEKLIVEARLNPRDRGYVESGQRAVVKISTYDFVRYGGLEGKVTTIAADADLDENRQPYFRVFAETEKGYLGDQPGIWPITPGMQATVDIRTGERTVLDFLLRPVLKLKHEAFRER
jgi:membrane fusion protein, adhesin transport system